MSSPPRYDRSVQNQQMHDSCQCCQQCFVRSLVSTPSEVFLAISLLVLQEFPPIIGRKRAEKNKDSAIGIICLRSDEGIVNAFEELFEVGVDVASSFVSIFAFPIEYMPRQIAVAESQ